MLPVSWPSQVTVRSVMSGEDRTLAMCASNALLSSGLSGVNAASQTRLGVTHLIEQRVEVRVCDRP